MGGERGVQSECVGGVGRGCVREVELECVGDGNSCVPYLGITREIIVMVAASVFAAVSVCHAFGLSVRNMLVYLDTCAGVHQYPDTVEVAASRKCHKEVLNAANKVEVYSREGLIPAFGWGIQGPSPGIVLSFAKLKASFIRAFDDDKDTFTLTRIGGT